MNLSEQLPTVHQVAAQYWGQAHGDIADALEAIQVIKRTGGKVMGVFPPFAEKPPVFYKVYFYDRGFNFESEGLKAANAMPPVEGVTVPKVVSICPEYRAILTEKEDWEENRTGLQRFFVGSLGIDWFRVGRWLRAFHDSQVSIGRNDYFLRKKFEKIDSHLKDLQHLFTEVQHQKLRKIIEDARKYFETAEIEWVISHGDFGLSNIQKKGELLEIIDFEDSQMAPRAFDILNCLVRLEYVNYFPNFPGTYKKIKERFLQGYDLQVNSDNSVYKLFYTLIQLDVIETYFRRRQLDKHKVHQKILFNIFEQKSEKNLFEWLDKLNDK